MPRKTSNEKLAEALTKVGLTIMAVRAECGWYNDFTSPLDLPAQQLDMDLMKAIRDAPDRATAKAIQALRERHHEGEFDATKAESDAWARSPEGQAAFASLLGRRGDR